MKEYALLIWNEISNHVKENIFDEDINFECYAELPINKLWAKGDITFSTMGGMFECVSVCLYDVAIMHNDGYELPNDIDVLELQDELKYLINDEFKEYI